MLLPIDQHNTELFWEKALNWSCQFEVVTYFNSNNYTLERSNVTKGYKKILGILKKDAFFSEFILKKEVMAFNKWALGFISYDYKNILENLPTPSKSDVQFPDFYFFYPDILLFENDQGVFYVGNDSLERILEEIENSPTPSITPRTSAQKINAGLEKKDYLNRARELQEHIQQGDIYEVNYCLPYYMNQVEINPVQLYNTLNKISPAPMSCFVKWNDQYTCSASPERFMKKEKERLLIQPMKGTAPRSGDILKDEELKRALAENPKERSENIMIVDLTRNDLSKIAKKGTVEVNELCQVHSFPRVHQMISTISCQLKDQLSLGEVLKAVFPMGSMTGAPKIRAMELIDAHEPFARNLFSGSVGYIDPTGDFDFNVLIRSLFYDAAAKKLSYAVGSAITALSDLEKEYEECLLKKKNLDAALKKIGILE